MRRLLLGIDTSGETYSLALQRGDLLGERTGGQPRRQLTELFPALQELCAECGVRLREVQGVAVTAGPGSFTGVRTGLLIARTVAQSLQVPLYPLDTLEVLAAGAPDGRVVAALDARKGEVVWAPFLVRNGWPTWLAAARLEAPELVTAALEGVDLVVGSACRSYGLQPASDPALWTPRASNVARLATRAPAQAWARVRPGYVRPADVQVHGAGPKP